MEEIVKAIPSRNMAGVMHRTSLLLAQQAIEPRAWPWSKGEDEKILRLRNKGKTIEEIVNKWQSELEPNVREFNKLAGEVSVWDRALIDNGNAVRSNLPRTNAC